MAWFDTAKKKWNLEKKQCEEQNRKQEQETLDWKNSIIHRNKELTQSIPLYDGIIKPVLEEVGDSLWGRQETLWSSLGGKKRPSYRLRLLVKKHIPCVLETHPTYYSGLWFLFGIPGRKVPRYNEYHYDGFLIILTSGKGEKKIISGLSGEPVSREITLETAESIVKKLMLEYMEKGLNEMHSSWLVPNRYSDPTGYIVY